MNEEPDQSRRRLLVGLPMAPAAVLLGASGAQADDAGERAVPADPRQPRFETTDHVACFYRLARD